MILELKKIQLKMPIIIVSILVAFAIIILIGIEIFISLSTGDYNIPNIIGILFGIILNGLFVIGIIIVYNMLAKKYGGFKVEIKKY